MGGSACQVLPSPGVSSAQAPSPQGRARRFCPRAYSGNGPTAAVPLSAVTVYVSLCGCPGNPANALWTVLMPSVYMKTEFCSSGSCTSGTRRLNVVLPMSTVMTSVTLTTVPGLAGAVRPRLEPEQGPDRRDVQPG